AGNLTGVFLAMEHEITHMRASGGGVIINTASTLGAHMRLPFLGAYAATKAAVSALTRAAAREYIADGIRVNAISPGPIDTSMSLLPGETEAGRDQRLQEALPAGQEGAPGGRRGHRQRARRRRTLARLRRGRLHRRARPRHRRRRHRLS